MRLGVLPLGGAPLGVLDTEVLTALRAAEIDVITPEAETPPIGTGIAAVKEAQRLQRADCDGVLIFVGHDTAPEGEADTDPAAICAMQAALPLAATPLLLSGLPSSAFFSCAGALEAVGVPFDRRFCVSDFELSALPEYLLGWLQENRRENRHRGQEAARRLYGRRLHFPPPFPTPDPARWMHQFGVIVGRSAAEADFAAEDGDALDALTAYLLRLIAGNEATIHHVPVWGERHESTGEGATATFARIVERVGRYRCVITRGETGGDLPGGGMSVWHFACADDRLFAVATFAEFCGVTGDYVGALRFACHALDIEPIVLT